MKENIITIVLSILIGFLLTKFTYSQYQADYNIKTVFNADEEITFLKYKTVESLDEIENIDYIYSIEDNKYNIYIGITNNKKNIKKLKEFYKTKEYIVNEEKIPVNNKEFIKILKQYDLLLNEVTDEIVIETINKEVLEKYKELVINNNEN